MKKRISITASIAFAALFSFAGTAGAVVNDGNSNLQHYQNAYQMEAYEGGGGGGGYVPNTTTTCGSGHYRSGSSCYSCSAGTYKAGTNTNTSCSTCAAGTYSSAGASSCTTCPAGKYSSAGASSCTACAAGKFSAAGASSCTTCAAGTYSAAGASTCTSCPSGTTSPAGSTSSSACVTVAATNTVSGNCPNGMKKSSDGNSCVIDVVTSMNVSAACYNYALSATASAPRDDDLAYY